VSAVDFLIRQHGKDALVGLIRSYADGRTDDEAFQAATGQTMAAFSDAWLADADAKIPVKAGPQPPPAGPLPSGWTGPLPSTPAGADSSVAPTASGAAAAAPSATPAGEDTGSSNSAGIVAVVVLLAAVLIGGGVLVARSRREGDA